ncbi:minor tail protein [Rhodobacter phage RcZahn]|nr:minor tail protein [Rhodobacter phage RcZahn]
MTQDGVLLKFGSRVFDDPSVGIEYAITAIREAWDDQVGTVSAVLKDYLTSVAQELASKHGQAWPNGTTSSTLSKRTGRAVDSIIRSVSVKGTTWETLMGKIGGIHYLAIHEYGGTIKSKGKLMTIPLPAALSGRGTSPPFARQWKDTFVARSKKGNLIIFQKRGLTIVPLYVLKNEVYIPPRLGMRKELEEQLPYFLSRAADRIVDDFSRKVES